MGKDKTKEDKTKEDKTKDKTKDKGVKTEEPHKIIVSNGSPYAIWVNCDTDRTFKQQGSNKFSGSVGIGK